MFNKAYLLIISFSLTFAACHLSKSTKMSEVTESHDFTNALINESSPYLLQHAHNPVNWYPWGEEALKKAKDENKLLIISIGYSACHWCHVMEHESFEDTTVARIMNKYFVPIKVDREERPDVDDVYMTACHLVSGRGGWPLNAFALPDGRPIWAGTYFPKDQWINILNQFNTLNQEQPTKLLESADQITTGIADTDNLKIVTEDQTYTKATLDQIANTFVNQVDLKKGGRQGSPKFPMPNNYEFLTQYAALTNNEKTAQAVKVTLDEMAKGGIYDQIGGGWARYSVDGEWHVPHFEKMLYDNGQLISLYANAYKQTKDPFYKFKIEQSLEFIERELTSPERGFYSSLDADSEGVEGKFYVWKKTEIDSLFPKDNLIIDYYNIKGGGNWEHGNNILRTLVSDQEFIQKHGLGIEELYTKREAWNEKLMQARSKKIRPGLDDKILTSWNALMLRGYVDAYEALENKEYLNRAIQNAKFLLKNQVAKDYRVNRNYKDGKSSINGFLDDYALLIDALVSLYQSTFDEQWINEAKELTDYAIVHFFKESNGMFNYTSDLDPPLVARKMELSDNVIPASNSIMAKNLKVLGELLYDKNYVDKSNQMLANVHELLQTSQSPSFYSNWCQLYLLNAHPPYEIAIIGDNAEELRQEMMSHYFPNSIFLGGKDEGDFKLLENKLQEGRTMIYVCQNKACKFPVDNVEAAIKLMR